MVALPSETAVLEEFSEIRGVGIFLLAGAVTFAFGGAYPFHLDDHSLFLDPGLRSPSGWLDVFRLTTTRPLTWLTFWLNFRFSDAPYTFHAVNLVIHLISTVLAWRVLSRIVSSQSAFLATVIFALHPLQAEPVIYVYARATLLATLFCWVSFDAWSSGKEWRAVGWFALALLSKEEVVAFPLFLALLAWWRDRTLSHLPSLSAMVALSAGAGLRVYWAGSQVAGSGVGPHAAVSSFQYFSTQGIAILRYVRQFLLPYGFTIESPLSVPPAWLGLAAWASVLILVWYSFRYTGPWVAAGTLLLLPSSSVFAASELSADRRMYFPIAAFAVALAILVQHLPFRLNRVAAVAGVVLTVLSMIVASRWRTEEALWRSAHELAPGKVRPLRQLARLRPPQEALRLLLEARQLAPQDADVAGDLGRAYLRLQRPEEALAEFGRALALAPRDPAAINNRGVALQALGQRDAALRDFETALKIDPCLWDAHWNLKQAFAPQPDSTSCRWTPEQRRLISPPSLSRKSPL